jgi:hypothetical protein
VKKQRPVGVVKDRQGARHLSALTLPLFVIGLPEDLPDDLPEDPTEDLTEGTRPAASARDRLV